MSGKINVSVCRGHELANALYIYIYIYIRFPSRQNHRTPLRLNGFPMGLRVMKQVFFSTDAKGRGVFQIEYLVGVLFLCSPLITFPKEVAKMLLPLPKLLQRKCIFFVCSLVFDKKRTS